MSDRKLRLLTPDEILHMGWTVDARAPDSSHWRRALDCAEVLAELVPLVHLLTVGCAVRDYSGVACEARCPGCRARAVLARLEGL